MPDIYLGKFGNGHGTWITVGGDYKPGDPPPTGYLDWHEWAEVQEKAGLRQKRCCYCSLLKYPQELSDKAHVDEARDRKGRRRRIFSVICKECAAKQEASP